MKGTILEKICLKLRVWFEFNKCFHIQASAFFICRRYIWRLRLRVTLHEP